MNRLPVALLLVLACGPDKDPTQDGDTSATLSDTDPNTDPTSPTTGFDTSKNPAGFCSPAEDPQCPEGFVCCSDDPATVGGKIPNYFAPLDDVHGVPIFSGNNNPLSYSGQCVLTGGFTSPFANGCPVPCNPTWEPDRLLEICGATTTCCAFTELDPTTDCVLDPDTQKWRAVTGADIPDLTSWGGQHTTNQDPVGTSCMIFASGGGSLDQDVYADCVRQLTVADQRGFCYDPAGCPCREDLCDMKNPSWVPRCSAPPPP